MIMTGWKSASAPPCRSDVTKGVAFSALNR
jgi:hypothetical protein